jgi:hypothetical protein
MPWHGWWKLVSFCAALLLLLLMMMIMASLGQTIGVLSDSSRGSTNLQGRSSTEVQKTTDLTRSKNTLMAIFNST